MKEGAYQLILAFMGEFFKVSESPGNTVPLNSRPVPLNFGIIWLSVVLRETLVICYNLGI